MRQVFLGGVRSGKSQLAEAAVVNWQSSYPHGEVTYVATAQIEGDQTANSEGEDQELLARIAEHKLRRPASWKLCEEPLALAQLLQEFSETTASEKPTCVLIDCLTLWLTNMLCQGHMDERAAAAAARDSIDDLTQAVTAYGGELIIVSNEVGSGIVPLGALSRQFTDLSGHMNQQIAKVCDQATLVVAGLPLPLKH